MAIVHFSGPRMDFGGRIIQRCTACGAKLCDSLNVAMPLNPDGSTPKFPTWPEGRLIEVEAGQPTRSTLLPDSDRIPANSCLEFA